MNNKHIKDQKYIKKLGVIILKTKSKYVIITQNIFIVFKNRYINYDLNIIGININLELKLYKVSNSFL